MGIFGGIFEFGLKVFGWFLDRANASMAAKQSFINFVTKWVGSDNKPADLTKSYYDQIKTLLAPKEPKP